MPSVRALLVSFALLMVAGCSEEAPPPQPAPPADRNFTATVNDTPVVGGTEAFACQFSTMNDTQQPQYLLTFIDDNGHTIQVGIERGGARAGNRKVLYSMATAEGRAYGRPTGASAALSAIVPTPQGAVISGRFSLELALVNSAPGVTDKSPLRVSNALFEQVECLDPSKFEASGRS